MTLYRSGLWVFLLWLGLACPSAARALTNGLALTPPMGWNDWNTFHCSVSESLVQQTADAMATNGMKAAGYVYVNIDDGWASSRGSNGVIQADSGRFPHGIPWLADYVHAKGLKLGLYTDHGTNTCSSCISGATPPKQPGSYLYEYVDAMTYASWGVDYLKNDSCNQPPGDVPYEDYLRMMDGLLKSGRPILVSICENREHYEYWSPGLGNLWRTTGDIGNTFSSMASKIDPNSHAAYVAGPGRWNDADMMEVGYGEFTNAIPAQAHFAMWCIMAAPLIAGNDIRNASAQTLSILTHAEAIAVDQDPAGEQGIRVAGTTATGEVWSKPLGYDFTTRAVVLLNRDANNPMLITCYWTNLALQAGSATVRDLWAHTDLGAFNNSFTTNVPPKGAVLLKVVGTPVAPPPLGTNYLSDLQPIYAYTGFGTLTKDKSIGGNTLTLGGVTYSKGIGTHAIGGHEYNLGGVVSRFQSDLGLDDEVGGAGSVIFQVFADGMKIYDSGIMTGNSATKTIDLDVSGVTRLTLGVTDTGNDVTGNRNSNDHSDWAGARLIVTNTVPVPPPAPTGLTASPGNPINLAWDATRGAIGYNLKRSIVHAGPYTNIGVASFNACGDTNATLGTTYYYVVSATNRFGESANSTEVTVASCSLPAVPTNLVTSVSNAHVLVRWNASAGASSYSIGRFGPDSPIVAIASGITGTNYTDAAVIADGLYYYVVAASNACNQSAFSAFVSAIVPAAPPAAPTGLSAVPGNTVASLSWTAVSGATGYNVKRSVVSSGTYTVVGSNIAPTSYLDTGLANGSPYYYVVSAVNAGGESPDSTEVSVTPSTPVTAYWTNTLTGSAQSWNVNPNWTNAAGFPNSVSVLAVINANIAADQTINLNQGITIGALSIGDPDSSSAYTLAANGGTLNFSGTNMAVLTELATSKGDTIAAPVTLATNLTLINNSANPLTLAGAISGSGAITINAGTVQVGDGSTSGSLGVDVTDNGALVLSRSDNVTVGNVISGTGTLTKKGAGVFTLSGANTFSGLSTVAQGTLKIGSGTALGTTAGGTTVSNGATLDFNHNNIALEPVTVSGAGVGSNGALVDNSGNSSFLSPQSVAYVTLTGDTVFGGTGRWDLRSNPTSTTNAALSTGGHPYKLTKVGSNQVSIVAVLVDPALGDIEVQAGVFSVEKVTTSLGNPANTLTVFSNATLQFYQESYTLNKPLTLRGSATVLNSSGANTYGGPVTLQGDATFNVAGTSLTFTNVISGAGGAIKTGASPLFFNAANTYVGATIINAGTLTLSGSSSISNSPTLSVASGATLDASGHSGGGITLATSQTLSGNGIVKGNLTVGNGATLAPGGSIGTLILSNSLVLASGSKTVIEVSKSPPTNDVVQAAGSVTYGGTLVVTNVGPSPLAAGDSFNVFNAAAYSGAFTNLVPAVPGAGLAWNTNGLTNGILRVALTPVPGPPFITGIACDGTNVTISGTNGSSGGTYYVLATTNITLPLPQWTPLATNQFDPDGNFVFTNASGPAVPRKFLLLRLP